VTGVGRGQSIQSIIAVYLVAFFSVWSLVQKSIPLQRKLAASPHLTIDGASGISSLDRLLQLATIDDELSITPTCHTNDTTRGCEDDVTPLPQSTEVLYVNCAATQHEDSADTAPLSLLQCHDLLQRVGALNNTDDDNVVTIVPRDDIFLASTHSTAPTAAALTLPRLAPFGTLHFHARPNSNSSQHGATHLAEIAWFVDRMMRHNQTHTFYYPHLARTLAQAYGCTPSNGSSKLLYQCPSPADSSAWIAPESVWDTVRPIMYQWPSQSNAIRHQQPKVVDPVTPSVGIFRHAFCEMHTGRLLLHTPIRQETCRCRNNLTTTKEHPTVHHQVLIQLNQCNVPGALASSALNKKSYEPFKLRVSPTTLAIHSRAHVKFDSAIVISARWMGDFYHTAVEHLPRLLLLRDFILGLPDQTMPIVVSNGWKKAYNLLKHYADIWGLGHRLVFIGALEVVYAKTMYIPEPSTCLALQPIMAQAQRNAIRTVLRQQPVSANQSQVQPPLNVDAAASTLPVNTVNTTEPSISMLKSTMDNNGGNLDTDADWIVVVRRNKTRFLRNHDEMMAALTTALPNEKWYIFDEGNPDGKFPSPGIPQWQVFARAKLIVAPHGAGLANLLACRSNIDVVEMLGEGGDGNLCFLHMSLALGLRYHPVHMINPYRGWNYEADIAQVVHVVSSIVQSGSSRTDSPDSQSHFAAIA
jgi:Glycosyltransferase 61